MDDVSKALPIPTPPLEAVSRHLRALLSDFRDYEIRESYKPLMAAALTGASEVCDAVDHYFLNPNGDQLNREVIGSLLDFIQRWETWLDTSPLTSPISTTFHSMLLRYTKGVVKAFRIWRIDGLA